MAMQSASEISGFHAHIYYDLTSRSIAAQLRKELAAKFEVTLGRWHDRAIGPHPQAMYQVAFPAAQFGLVVPWLMLHRSGLDILVHPSTGDDVADHTDHALWLGNKLDLNIASLRPARTALDSASNSI